MKLYQRKLVEFMKAKKEKTWGSYFLEKDEKTLMRWPDARAKAVWRKICYLIKHSWVCGLTTDVCPFCLIYWDKKCKRCTYSNNYSRGICFKMQSEFGRMYRERFGHTTASSYTILPNTFYVELVSRINKTINNREKKK